jgi:hypothetical protein
MIELKGYLTNPSVMDSNIFVITTEGGQHIGDFTLTDMVMLEKIEKEMKALAIVKGDLPPGGDRPRFVVKLPITLTIKKRK